MTALNENTGAVLWTHTYTSPFSINPPTYDSGQVYIQTDTGNEVGQLWSYNAATGATTWVSPFGCQWESYLAPAVADGKIFVDAGTYGGMYGYNQATGAQLFFTS